MFILKKNIAPLLFLILYTLNSIIFSYLTHSSYGLISFTSDIMMLSLFLIPYYYLKNKYKFYYLFIIAFFLSSLISFYYGYYNYFTMFYGLNLFSTLKGNLFNILNIRILIFFMPLIILIINKFLSEEEKTYKKFYIIPLLTISMILTSINITDIDVGRFRKQWNKEHIIDKFGIHLYIVNDLIWNLSPKINELFKNEDRNQTVINYFKDQDDKVLNQYSGIFEGKNLIVIHAESLQTLPLFMTLENGQEVTPHLNKIITESLYFSNFYAQDGLGTSSDSEFTFNTGLLPSKKGSVAINYWDNYFLALPTLLANKGYVTRSMHANHGNYWNRRFFHQSLGYDYFYFESKDYILDEIIGLGLSDASFLRQSVIKIEELSQNQQPFMATLITLTNHAPFRNIIPYSDFDAGEYEGKAFGNYLKSVNYMDQAIKEFFVDLEEKNLLDNTVVVIYGDHDAQLRRNTYKPYYENNPEDLYYLNGIFEETMTYQLHRKVPFIIYSKDLKPLNITDISGMYDVLPTLANMFSLETSYTLGRDLFNQNDNNYQKPFVVLADGSWITNEVYFYKKKEKIYYLTETFYTDEQIEHYHNRAKEILLISNKIIEGDLIPRI
jgi:Phosphoglycerol transferase and related proteins, alkaline phosphatase superfamily